MKKHLKIFSVVLSFVLAVCSIQTVFIQAFAADEDTTTVAYGESTDDELDLSYPINVEIANAEDSIPEAVVIHSFGDYDMSFWNDVVFRITYKDGYVEYFQSDFNFYGYAVDVPKHYAEQGSVSVSTQAFGNAIEIEFCNYFTSLEVNTVNAPDRIIKYELTKLPDKVFDAPYFTGEIPSYDDLQECDAKNSVAANMKGAELTLTRANGEKEILTIEDDASVFLYYFAAYSVLIDNQYVTINVYDYGDYNACITVEDYSFTIENLPSIFFTVKSVDDSNPELPKTDHTMFVESVGTPDEGAKSTTDEVATPDSTKSTNDNAVVATGDCTVAAGVAVVMIFAAAAMIILKRRKSTLN